MSQTRRAGAPGLQQESGARGTPGPSLDGSPFFLAGKSNEIPAARILLERLELDGTIALMDALHPQVETARTVVQGGGGDYVLISPV